MWPAQTQLLAYFGEHQTHVENVSWPPPQKWDTHNNVFFDEASQTYVVTTRSVPEEPTGLERETSLTRSIGPKYAFDFSVAPPVILRGNISHQTYAQVTFPWLNVYLGLVMVFDQDTGDQVHCRLTVASRPEGPWHPVEGDNIIKARDFLPFGEAKAFDSHVIFAAARPFRHGSGADAEERMGVPEQMETVEDISNSAKIARRRLQRRVRRVRCTSSAWRMWV